MPVTKEQVITLLQPDEPDYALAAKLGGEAIPYIIELVKAGDPKLASRATYLAAFIDLPGSADIIEMAGLSLYHASQAYHRIGFKCICQLFCSKRDFKTSRDMYDLNIL